MGVSALLGVSEIHSFTRCTEALRQFSISRTGVPFSVALSGGYAFAGVWFTEFVCDVEWEDVISMMN